MDSHEFSNGVASEARGRNLRVGDAITRWMLYILFFGVPLFFLPWTSEAFEINKQTLFVILAGIACASWLFSMVLGRRMDVRTGLMAGLPALFLLTVFLSSLFSLAGYQSWVGQLGQEYTSFLSIALFVLFFYVLLNKAKDAWVQHHLLFALFLSGAIGSVIALLYSLGIAAIPGVDTQGFNTVGTINGFVTIATVLMHMGFALWLVSRHGSNKMFAPGWRGLTTRVCIVVIALVSVFLMVSINFWLFWVMNMVGVALLAAFALLATRAFPSPKRFVVPLLLLVVSVVFLFAPSPYKLKLPLVVSVSHGAGWGITKSVLSENTKQLFLGSGPGTFMYDYSKFKPAGVNQSRFWSIRFDRAKSHLMTMLATLGILGALAWLAFVGFLLFKALGRFVRGGEPDEWKMSYALFVGWFVLTLAQVLYVSTFTSQFLFWGLSGLLAAHVAGKVFQADFEHAPRMSLASVFAFVIVGIGILTAMFVSGERYLADFAYAKALRLDRAGAEQSQVADVLTRAVRFNGLNDMYHQSLGRVRLAEASTFLKESKEASKDGKLTPEQLQQLKTLVDAGVQASTRATVLAPNDSLNWVLQSAVYRDLMSYVNGAEEQAAGAINRAITLDPGNPSHYVNLGRVYITLAERARALLTSQDKELAAKAKDALSINLVSAEQALKTAVAMKPDYAAAHYQLAIVYERAGRLMDSRAQLKELTEANPLDVGLGLEHGLLLLRLNESKEAEVELLRVLEIQPDYANAIWFLASAYELQGKRTEAMAQVQKLIDKDPMNKVVQERMARMRRGEITTKIPEPVEPVPMTAPEAPVAP